MERKRKTNLERIPNKKRGNMMHYTFHSQMGSQTTHQGIWTISTNKLAQKKIEVGEIHLTNKVDLTGGNSLQPLDPVDSNPIGAN